MSEALALRRVVWVDRWVTVRHPFSIVRAWQRGCRSAFRDAELAVLDELAVREQRAVAAHRPADDRSGSSPPTSASTAGSSSSSNIVRASLPFSASVPVRRRAAVDAHDRERVTGRGNGTVQMYDVERGKSIVAPTVQRDDHAGRWPLWIASEGPTHVASHGVARQPAFLDRPPRPWQREVTAVNKAIPSTNPRRPNRDDGRRARCCKPATGNNERSSGRHNCSSLVHGQRFHQNGGDIRRPAGNTAYFVSAASLASWPAVVNRSSLRSSA
jgi:hypothetical protein